MPEFVIDTCITIRAMNQEAAAFHAGLIADHLRFKLGTLIQGVHVCQVEPVPPECPDCEEAP